jgi:hypothetical protein
MSRATRPGLRHVGGDPMTEPEVDQILLARVTITRVLTGTDVIDHVEAEAVDGTDLGLAEALGMLELAKFTLVESYGKEE